MDIYVDAQIGDDTWDGTSPTFVGGLVGPVASIGGGHGVANPGDTIHIAPGYYEEGVAAAAAGNVAATTDGGYAVLKGYYQFTGGQTGCSLTGLHIVQDNTFSNTPAGWGLTNDSTYTDCVFDAYDSALHAQANNVIFLRCIVTMDEDGGFGGGILVVDGAGTGVQITNCAVFDKDGSLASSPFRLKNAAGSVAVNGCIFASSATSTQVVHATGGWATSFTTAYTGNNNNYWKNGATDVADIVGEVGSPFNTIAAFAAYTGQDAASIDADPLWTDPSRFLFGLKTGSPCLNPDGITPKMGPRNLSVIVRQEDGAAWGGSGWTFPNGNGALGVGNTIEITAGTLADARNSFVGIVPVGKQLKTVRFAATETNTTGDTADVIDRTAFVANTPNPPEVGVEENSGAATFAYVTRQRGKSFTGAGGTNIHIELHLRTDGRVRQ